MQTNLRMKTLKSMIGQGHVTYFLNFGTPSITFERNKLDTSFFFFVGSIVASTTQWMMNDPKRVTLQSMWAERERSKFPLTAHASFCNPRSPLRSCSATFPLPLYRIFFTLRSRSFNFRTRSAQGLVYRVAHHGPQKTSWPHSAHWKYT